MEEEKQKFGEGGRSFSVPGQEESIDPAKAEVTTCVHFLNGVYSVSIFDNGDLMCKSCASIIIENPNIQESDPEAKYFVQKNPIELYYHLKKIYEEKAGAYDPEYPNMYLRVLKNLGLLNKDLYKELSKIKDLESMPIQPFDTMIEEAGKPKKQGNG